jgi:hypothetical protein
MLSADDLERFLTDRVGQVTDVVFVVSVERGRLYWRGKLNGAEVAGSIRPFVEAWNDELISSKIEITVLPWGAARVVNRFVNEASAHNQEVSYEQST